MGRKRFINFFLFSHPSLPDQMRPKGQRVVHFQGSSLGKAKKHGSRNRTTGTKQWNSWDIFIKTQCYFLSYLLYFLIPNFFKAFNLFICRFPIWKRKNISPSESSTDWPSSVKLPPVSASEPLFPVIGKAQKLNLCSGDIGRKGQEGKTVSIQHKSSRSGTIIRPLAIQGKEWSTAQSP